MVSVDSSLNCNEVCHYKNDIICLDACLEFKSKEAMLPIKMFGLATFIILIIAVFLNVIQIFQYILITWNKINLLKNKYCIVG